MLFSYLFTTSSPLPLLIFCLYSEVWHILLVVPVVGDDFSAHSCYSCRLFCFQVTRGLGENGRNFSCNVGATQLIRIFLPPPFCKSTQLCGFDILPPSRNANQLCGFGTFNSFRHGPCNGSPIFPPDSPPFLPPPSVFPIIVWMGGLLALDVQRSIYPLVPYSPPYPPPVPTIVSPSLSTQLNASIVLQYISGLLLALPQIPQIPLIPSFVWY